IEAGTHTYLEDEARRSRSQAIATWLQLGIPHREIQEVRKNKPLIQTHASPSNVDVTIWHVTVKLNQQFVNNVGAGFSRRLHRPGVIMIHIEREGAVSVIRMEHGKVQAMDLELMTAFNETLDELRSIKPGAVIITGTGNAFSAGVDL